MGVLRVCPCSGAILTAPGYRNEEALEGSGQRAAEERGAGHIFHDDGILPWGGT